MMKTNEKLVPIDAEADLADLQSGGGGAHNLDAILRIPVTVQVVLGSAVMPVSNLMKLRRGTVIPLDQRVGEPVEIVVNGRVVARGEVVVADEETSRFGVSLTELLAPAAGIKD